MPNDSTEVVDLTQPLYEGMYTYRDDPEFRRRPAAHVTDADDGFQVSELTMGTHTGTHVDAPRHALLDGDTIDGFDVEEFRLGAVKVDVEAHLGEDGVEGNEPLEPDDDEAELLAEILGEEWDDGEASGDGEDGDGEASDDSEESTEEDGGEASGDGQDGDADDDAGDDEASDGVGPEDVDVVVFRTGWDGHWDDPQYNYNPYLPKETVDKCRDEGLHVAIDCPSPDPVEATREGDDEDENDDDGDESNRDEEPNDFYAHKELLGEGLFIFENLTNLGALPDDGKFELHTYPLPIVDGDGSPVRAVAVDTE